MPAYFKTPLKAGLRVICESGAEILVLEDPMWKEQNYEYTVAVCVVQGDDYYRPTRHTFFRHIRSDCFGPDLVFKQLTEGEETKTLEQEYFERVGHA